MGGCFPELKYVASMSFGSVVGKEHTEDGQGYGPLYSVSSAHPTPGPTTLTTHPAALVAGGSVPLLRRLPGDRGLQGQGKPVGAHGSGQIYRKLALRLQVTWPKPNAS